MTRTGAEVSAVCASLHFSRKMRELMSDAGIVDVLSCNSIADDSNRIDLTSFTWVRVTATDRRQRRLTLCSADSPRPGSG